ncbi:hypothetical protein EW145_g362 [Phellinidium pouzarii]|uniref:CUE domain-containing protein n=1 Tax=Phellinidium pouzarii TaxID=167371 RepID=A0A4S4LIX5_9AGAM|nr:hypothetical protein EW145_g362 [Phellinidium pouzarii]
MTVKIIDIHSLPVCPSSSTIHGLPPSQQSIVLDHTSSALLHALSLSDNKLSMLSCSDFISSYAKDAATKALSSLIFADEKYDAGRRPPEEKLIRKRVLSLAQRLAALQQGGGLSLQILLDLCIVYGPSNTSRMRSLLEASVKSNPSLLQDVQNSAAPSFAMLLLSSNSGLHALRKTLFCLKYFVQSSPSAVLDVLVHSNELVLALAKCYDTRLSAIAAGYGGIHFEQDDDTDTTAMWVGCKVALIDCFHVLLEQVLKGLHSDPRVHAERAFDLVFSLLQLPSTSVQTSAPQTPFLNRPLIVDYQDAYALSSTLATVLANTDDPRLDDLEAALKSFELEATVNDRCGALKVLLHSSGITPGIDYRGVGAAKGKTRAAADPESDADLDVAVSSVLSILPDYELAYIRELLTLPQYSGDAERVIAALLEGDAPAPSKVESDVEHMLPTAPVEVLPERRNVFNEMPMEHTSVNIGKRRGDVDGVLQDRTFLDQMKADILRRVEYLSESDEENSVFDDDIDGALDGRVQVAGDGEDSDKDEDDNAEVEEAPTPETICELSYISDPKVFDRDANTRRSKARADLKARTGWGDEQIEGWSIMLERNPRKDKILQKHEFTGNRRNADLPVAGASHSVQHDEGGNHRGRGRGRGGRGRGRGGGGGSRGGGSGKGDERGGGDARERSWKDKNKARQANHNRKRGHDKKMARGGGYARAIELVQMLQSFCMLLPL